jgi:hypothetical protein
MMRAGDREVVRPNYIHFGSHSGTPQPLAGRELSVKRLAGRESSKNFKNFKILKTCFSFEVVLPLE